MTTMIQLFANFTHIFCHLTVKWLTNCRISEAAKDKSALPSNRFEEVKKSCTLKKVGSKGYSMPQLKNLIGSLKNL